MTSEEESHITKQPKETCPMINEVISSIENALDRLKRWEKMEEGELRSACDYAEWLLGGIPSDMEDIRTNITAIRDWGEQWKEAAKDYHSQIPAISETV